jgi:hypothetical protein
VRCLSRPQSILHHEAPGAEFKRLSRARNVSEAEIVREALDRELHGDPPGRFLTHTRPSSRAEFIQQARAGGRGLNDKPLRWNRADLYAGGENRWTDQDPDGPGSE